VAGANPENANTQSSSLPTSSKPVPRNREFKSSDTGTFSNGLLTNASA
jgi:hypothetical protein